MVSTPAFSAIDPPWSPSVYRCVRLRTVYGVLVHNRSFGSKASLVSRDMFPRLPLPLRRRCSPVVCYPAPAIGVWFDRSPLKMAQLTMINEFTGVPGHPRCPEIEQPRCDREVGRVHAVARRSRACTVGQLRGNGRGACVQAVPYGTSDVRRGSVHVSVLASKTSKPQRQKPQ